MGVGGVILLVAGILLVVALGLALGLGPLLRKGKIARAALAEELRSDPALRGPEPANYRGTTGSTYSKVQGNGQLVLTAQRIAFVKATGGRVDVPVDTITSVETMKVFNRSRVGGSVHLVLHTRHGDVGYFVRDVDAWQVAIRTAARLP